MAERPILFSGPMVRAILAGQKTVTRRVVSPQPPAGHDRVVAMPLSTETSWHDDTRRTHWPESGWKRSPYGVPGDTLWVRETWCNAWDDTREGWSDPPRYHYRADGHEVRSIEGIERSPWKPSIHMPREASRLTLCVTDVRVERLHAITDEDARAEGIHGTRLPLATAHGAEVFHAGQWPTPVCADTPRAAFVALWESINGKRAPWASNPWVWRVAFERIEAPHG